MRVSTRGRYGLRAMFELARRYEDGPVVMSVVAEEQGLSRKHLHALLTALKSAGLVRSIRGPGGGFVLTRAPGQIRLSDVLEAVEGPLSLVDCVTDHGACDKVNRCAARRVWQELSDAIEDMLGNVTLEDMAAPTGRKCLGAKETKTRRRSVKKRAPKAKRSRVRSGD